WEGEDGAGRVAARLLGEGRRPHHRPRRRQDRGARHARHAARARGVLRRLVPAADVGRGVGGDGVTGLRSLGVARSWNPRHAETARPRDRETRMAEIEKHEEEGAKAFDPHLARRLLRYLKPYRLRATM